MRPFAVALALLFAALSAQASVFGTVRVIVHDPQHRPIAEAKVQLNSAASEWTSSVSSGDDGIAQFSAVPIGQYSVRVESPGFAPFLASLTVISDRVVELHAPLAIAVQGQSVEVTASAAEVSESLSLPPTTVSRAQIAETPGADQTDSLAFITNYVPSAVMVHDQLHVRGGHQVTWAIDGVPVPNTNIASNVGPQFDPKDIQFAELQRGSFTADYGDRTYGVFNVAPRSGFERQREAELIASYGNFHQTNEYLSFGDHTDRFAYYASLNGNRTDHGLETPTLQNLHNQAAGGGGFTSLTYNAHNNDQLRFVGAFRKDYFQVPNDPAGQDAGVRDHEREDDGFASFTYLHPFQPDLMLNITPFFHYNRAAFEGGPLDVPSATDNRASTYAGGQVSLAYVRGKHNARAGVYAFGQHDSHLFGLVANDGTGNDIRQRQNLSGDLEAAFFEDQYRAFSWLTLSAGVRLTRFSGVLRETAASPRLGAAVRLPKLNWVLRASYDRFYQAPPLSTLSGPLLEFATAQEVGFLPLRGERDEQHDFGVTIPLWKWNIDVDRFRTGARNFFDHDALGNSNIFFPLTIDRVRIRGTEVAVRSPNVFGRAAFHLAYSRQSIEGQGGVTGGLTDFTPPEEGFFYLDHDQRDTLSTGVQTALPWRSWAALNVSYGSGFLDGDGPRHLPGYQTVDVAVGKSFGESWAVKATATNIVNERHFIDLSNTFGGSHANLPRMVSLQIRYSFHY
jgi:hypothetical protein